MDTKRNYLTGISVRGLWNRIDLRWELQPDVNVLSGCNGSGKSTLIRALVQMFRDGRLSPGMKEVIDKVIVSFEDGTSVDSSDCASLKEYPTDIISTFDNRLSGQDSFGLSTEPAVRTELDRELYRIQKKYLSYQLDQGKRAIGLLRSGAPESALRELTAHKERFFDILDDLFSRTGKRIDRESNELCFLGDWGKVSPYVLSSGEKQLLLILATALVRDNAPCLLMMDEPEISLHFDWQRVLIDSIRRINPNVQILLTTHSPAVVMDGWMGHVTEMEEIVVPK